MKSAAQGTSRSRRTSEGRSRMAAWAAPSGRHHLPRDVAAPQEGPAELVGGAPGVGAADE